jgi:hypothetical protein
MKFIKRFESHEEGMSRQEMCDMLCSMGYEMNELEVCSDSELAEICRNSDMKMSNESESMSREEMCDMLCNCGYSMEELEGCSEYELAEMCRNSNMNRSEGTYESRRLRENRETENYMFFGNLETMKNMIDDLLQMDESEVDSILSEHDWASDHISVAAENLEHVYNFLSKNDNPNNKLIGGPKAAYPMPVDSEPSFDETEGQLSNNDLEDEMSSIKSFKNFK